MAAGALQGRQRACLAGRNLFLGRVLGLPSKCVVECSEGVGSLLPFACSQE